MTPDLASAALPLLRRIDAERAHRIGIAALRLGLAGTGPVPDKMLATEAFGLRFASPIGLGAGFDKNAEAVAPLIRLGFGFVEIGTVTPRPQAGNPKPRLFRLEEDQAVINRMGFNGDGADIVAGRLSRLCPHKAPLGINLGLNKTGADPLRDYANLAARFAPIASYLVINVSSPNTPGLRDLQSETKLAAILASLPKTRPPVLVKLAPDLAESALTPIIETCIGGGVDGLIISNTTIARPALRSRHARETGGLSGAPLFSRSTAMLARAFLLAAGRLTLIGAGGVASGADALTKLKAGASLVQLYTAFAYAGPCLAGRLNRDLAAALTAGGFSSPAEAVGADAHRLSAGAA